eukprot:CAMPEP_0113713902 /NCGR_PEP_ID=MMETSP0038_2-20120614/32278_1 /TAXON_ID=2898 /ORGANISM="Cryptomonas paramecium" /LENGTH=125 /DNA_ID=CAMNT_0000640737 /DNA_START=86 /DNA_END=459 /DNA_ORIENTATION=+ /assembly_acc=CAM_ASM_000170
MIREFHRPESRDNGASPSKISFLNGPLLDRGGGNDGPCFGRPSAALHAASCLVMNSVPQMKAFPVRPHEVRVQRPLLFIADSPDRPADRVELEGPTPAHRPTSRSASAHRQRPQASPIARLFLQP